jgi:hypothetical protein
MPQAVSSLNAEISKGRAIPAAVVKEISDDNYNVPDLPQYSIYFPFICAFGQKVLDFSRYVSSFLSFYSRSFYVLRSLSQ